MVDTEKGHTMKRRATGDSEEPSKRGRKAGQPLGSKPQMKIAHDCLQNFWRQQAGQQRSKGGGHNAKIESGDCGIFVTCERGREKKCTAEMLDILSELAPPVEAEAEAPAEASDNEDDGEDIEAQIKKEMESMKSGESKVASKAPFQAVNLDIQCLVFIKMAENFNPVQTVHSLCLEAQTNPEKKQSRWVKRLTPVTTIRKILGGGLEEVAREVLKPDFHSGGPPKKYAIRPTIRNNGTWHKDTVVKAVAPIVGPDHSVDLKNYDLLILVDIVQNLCGMSVVGRDYDELKRYNISEIYSPTPLPQQTPSVPENPEAAKSVPA